MTEHQNEKLSALVDGEQDQETMQALVENASHRERWFRYQLASAVVRGDAIAGHRFDISAAVAAEVAKSPVLAPAKVSALAGLQRWLQRSGWMRPAASMAVAASVAVVTVISVQQLQAPTEVTNPAPQGRSVSTLETMPIGGVVNPVSFNTVHTPSEQMDVGVERRLLQSFMMDHQQQLQLSQQQEVATLEAEAEVTPEQPEPDSQ
ncbi:sigma-E factor negative regulatory protein [Aliidiomarina indica]|uniref:sigma-E factor negative regulatory protein n=1 Tax=Aliidiomarina indica TaxID=2749147 RepID=UPI001890723A|nr:RseA family anti-sigma factor [Aliidiomarina indica]